MSLMRLSKHVNNLPTHLNTIIIFKVYDFDLNSCLTSLSCVGLQEDLSQSNQEVMKCKHHKKHYEEKRKTHLDKIQALKASLEGQEQELAVRQQAV